MNTGAKQDTALGGADGRFPGTSWSVLRNARDSDPAERTRALHRLIGLYWKPVYCVIRHSGKKNNEEAKDLTQEFFLTAVLEKSLADKFDPDRGSFRAFLKAAVMNFVRNAAQMADAQKRGGHLQILNLSIIDFDVAEMVPDAAAKSPEEVFDDAWEDRVLAQAIERLGTRLRAGGKDLYFEVFQRYDVNPAAGEISYSAVGKELGLGADTVKNYLTKARAEFRRVVAEVIRDTVDNDEDALAEMRQLFGA